MKLLYFLIILIGLTFLNVKTPTYNELLYLRKKHFIKLTLNIKNFNFFNKFLVIFLEGSPKKKPLSFT